MRIHTSYKSINILLSDQRSSIMGNAMICILLFHQQFLNNSFFDIFHQYGYWGVEVFLLISGIGIANSLRKNNLKRYYKNRIVRIMPACFLIGLVKVILFVYFDIGYYMELPIFFIISSLSLWFIFSIYIYYIIAPFLNHLIIRYGIRTLLFIILFSLIYIYKIHFLQGPYRWLLEMTIHHLPVFCLGIYLGINPHILNKKFLVFSLLALAAGVAVKNNIYNIASMTGSGYLYFFIMIASPLLCYLFAIVASLFDITNTFLKWIGNHTLEIYLIHELLFSYIHKNLFLDNSIKLVIALIITFFLSKILHDTINSLQLIIKSVHN